MSSGRISRTQIARILDLDEGFVVELERHELIRPEPGGTYDRTVLERVRVCWTMHHSLGVNMPGLEVALHLLDRWQGERARLARLLRELEERGDER